MLNCSTLTRKVEMPQCEVAYSNFDAIEGFPIPQQKTRFDVEIVLYVYEIRLPKFPFKKSHWKC